MPADEPPDQQPLSLLAMLAARYPDWTMWYGRATRRWWALPPRDREAGRFIEALSVKELVESIEAVRVHWRSVAPRSPLPGVLLFGAGEGVGRIPAAAWPGGDPR